MTLGKRVTFYMSFEDFERNRGQRKTPIRRPHIATEQSSMARLHDDTDNADAVVSGALGIVLMRRPDVDVTVAIGDVHLDVVEFTYVERRDRFVLHLHVDDLAEAVHKLTR